MSDVHELTDLDFDAPVVEPVDSPIYALARRELKPEAIDVSLLHQLSAIEAPAVYVVVGALWKRLRDEIDRRRAYVAKGKALAHAAWQEWLKMEHDFVDGLEAASQQAAGLLGAYDSEQRRIAEETRARLEQEERLKADAEQFVAALDADAGGEPEMAAEILAEPPMVAPPSVPIGTPKVAGMSTAGKWKAELAVPGNIDKLILEAALELTNKRARIAASMLKADTVAINQQATSMKGNLTLIAGKLGLKVWEDRTPRRGRG